MTAVSIRRRFTGTLVALCAILAVAIHVTWAPAAVNAVIGPVPTTTATISFSTPVDGLTAGSAVTFKVDSTGPIGFSFTSYAARICQHGFTSYNTVQYGYDGTDNSPTTSNDVRCVYANGITSGGLTGIQPSYQIAPTALPVGATTTGNVTFLAGTGTVNWLSNGGFSPTNPLTCDSTNACDLVIQIGTTGPGSPTGNKTYFIQPLTFAGSGTTTTTSSTTPGATTTTSSATTTQPATTTSSATTTRAATTTTRAATTTTRAATTTTRAATTTTSSTTTSTAPGATTTTTPGSAVTITPSTISPAGTVVVAAGGWQASSSVSVVLNSSPITLGALTADTNGLASGSFTIPGTVEPGSHTITMTGTDPKAVARSVSAPLTVVASGSGTGTGGTVTGGTGTTTGTSSGGALAFSGSATRNVASVALLLIAAGLFALGQASRRRPESS